MLELLQLLHGLDGAGRGIRHQIRDLGQTHQFDGQITQVILPAAFLGGLGLLQEISHYISLFLAAQTTSNRTLADLGILSSNQLWDLMSGLSYF